MRSQAAARLWREELHYSPLRPVLLLEQPRNQHGESQGPERQLTQLLDEMTAGHHRKFKAEVAVLPLRTNWETSNNLEAGYNTQIKLCKPWPFGVC